VMLETCWEGLERAGYTMEQLRGSLTGVFIGHSQVAAVRDGPSNPRTYDARPERVAPMEPVTAYPSKSARSREFLHEKPAHWIRHNM
jgi:hypothetical protein